MSQPETNDLVTELEQRARELGLATCVIADEAEPDGTASAIASSALLPAQPWRPFEPAEGVLAAVGPRTGPAKRRLVLLARLAETPAYDELRAACVVPAEIAGRLISAVSRVHGDLVDARALEAQSANFTRHLAQSYDNMSLLYRLGRSMNELRHPQQFVTGAVEGLCDTLGYRWTAAWFRDGVREVGDLAGEFIYSAEDSGLDAGTIRDELSTTSMSIGRGGAMGGENAAGVFAVESRIGPELVLQPIRINGVYAGLMAMGCKHGEDPQASSYDTQALEAVAGYVGTLLESVHLYLEQQSTVMGMLRALTASLDAKDRYTRGHSERVALLGRELALGLGMSDHDAQRIHVAGILHDIGKIGVPDHVLGKPARLTDDEFAMIKRHPRIGHDILKGIPAVTDVLPGVLYHHERFDGRGYPEGLAGVEIPAMARVLALADTFDSMSSNRAYRHARTREEVLAEIRCCAGAQFDPDMAAAFLELDFEPFDELIERHSRERVETQNAFNGSSDLAA